MICESHDQRLEWDTERGGRLVSWMVDGHEVLAHHGDHPVEYGMYAMAPWSGRLGGNVIRARDMERLGVTLSSDFSASENYPPWALHGTCFTAPIDHVEHGSDWLRTRQVIPEWPWSAELTSEWTVVHGGVDVRLRVEANEPSPALIGWHPWFRKSIGGAQGKWQVTHARMAVRDPQSERGAFPTGEWREVTPGTSDVDDGFVVADRAVTVTWPGVLKLEVVSSHPWFVIFDQLPDALCVEPQSQLPNAWQSPIDGESQIVRPGEPLELTTQWRWSRPSAH